MCDVVLCSSAQDASSPESSDSGIQTDHNNSTGHIDCLLPNRVTSSSCRHGNNNNNNADDDDNDNDTNNNHTTTTTQRAGGHVTGEVNPQGQGQGKIVEGHGPCNCESSTATCDVSFLCPVLTDDSFYNIFFVVIFPVIQTNFRLLDAASKFALFLVSDLKDEKQTYMKAKTCELNSRVF